MKKKIVIIGAGPAGLASGIELLKNKKSGNDLEVTILEKNNIVGGLARSYFFKGHYFDIGPHRFYTKNKEVLNFWQRILGKDLIEVKRLTRILYKDRYFYYPVQFKDVLIKLGPLDTLKCLLSFINAKIFLRNLQPKTFEEWIVKNFGRKLYEIFFKTYTEKVWGIPCNKIGAEWASQRIKNLNFVAMVKNVIIKNSSKKSKSLIEKFYYPIQGAGQLYFKIAKIIQERNGKIYTNSPVLSISHGNNKITSLKYKHHVHDKEIKVDHLFSSMPLTHFIFALNPKPPQGIINAAKKLYYRDHITVNLIIKRASIFPDNWIYVNSPDIKMARIANYNNFKEKPEKEDSTAISVEYFVFKNDDIWKLKDSELIELAKKELAQIKLVSSDEVGEGFVVRETESYPTYYMGHLSHFNILKDYVSQFSNLQLIGRGGMYRYNNQDHAIYSGLLAAKNYLLGYKKYNIWNINEDAEYLEEANFEN